MARTQRTPPLAASRPARTAPLPTTVDANAEFEAAIARLKELSSSENLQVSVKAASDLAKLLRPHVRPAEPEKTLEQREAELVKSIPDFVALMVRLVREGKAEAGEMRSQLALALKAVDESLESLSES